MGKYCQEAKWQSSTLTLRESQLLEIKKKTILTLLSNNQGSLIIPLLLLALTKPPLLELSVSLKMQLEDHKVLSQGTNYFCLIQISLY